MDAHISSNAATANRHAAVEKERADIAALVEQESLQRVTQEMDRSRNRLRERQTRAREMVADAWDLPKMTDPSYRKSRLLPDYRLSVAMAVLTSFVIVGLSAATIVFVSPAWARLPDFGMWGLLISVPVALTTFVFGWEATKDVYTLMSERRTTIVDRYREGDEAVKIVESLLKNGCHDGAICELLAATPGEINRLRNLVAILYTEALTVSGM